MNKETNDENVGTALLEFAKTWNSDDLTPLIYGLQAYSIHSQLINRISHFSEHVFPVKINDFLSTPKIS